MKALIRPLCLRKPLPAIKDGLRLERVGRGAPGSRGLAGSQDAENGAMLKLPVSSDSR